MNLPLHFYWHIPIMKTEPLKAHGLAVCLSANRWMDGCMKWMKRNGVVELAWRALAQAARPIVSHQVSFYAIQSFIHKTSIKGEASASAITITHAKISWIVARTPRCALRHSLRSHRNSTYSPMMIVIVISVWGLSGALYYKFACSMPARMHSDFIPHAF